MMAMGSWFFRRARSHRLHRERSRPRRRDRPAADDRALAVVLSFVQHLVPADVLLHQRDAAAVVVFAAEDEADWSEWVVFFSRTREADGRCKGLVEIQL